MRYGDIGGHRSQQAARSQSSGQKLSLPRSVGSQMEHPGGGSVQPCLGVDSGHPLLENLLNQKWT